MKIRIREGNDFDVAWAIKRAGMPEDLSTAINMKLTLVVYGLVIEHSLFTVTDNVLSINIPKEVATVNGDYRLIFEYTLPDAGQPDGDLKCKTDVVPFRIVPFTAKADDIYTINVTSDIAIGLKGDKGDDGDDAYQIWLDLGNVGTYEDYITWLRQPAIDAAALANIKAGLADTAATAATTAAGEADAATLAANTAATNAQNVADTVDGRVTTVEDDLVQLADEVIAKANEIRELYNKIKIEPIFTQGKAYDSSGNLFDTSEFQYASFDVSAYAGGWITISPAIPWNFAGKSMVVSQTGVNTLFEGTYGSEITVQLSTDAKDIKLSQFFDVETTIIWAYSKGLTTPFISYDALKNEFDNFKDLDLVQSPVVNLFDKATMVLNQKYINPTTGVVGIAGSTNERVARIPLTAGTYAINLKTLPINYDKIFIETEIGTPDVASGVLYNSLPYDQTGKGRVLTVTNPNAKYLIMQVSTTVTLDYRDAMQVQKGTFVSNYEAYKKRVSSIIGAENNPDYYSLFTTITDHLKNNNLLYGKKLGVLGDSITVGYGLPTNTRYARQNSYAVQLAEKNNMSLNVSAVTGTHISVSPSGELGNEFVNRWNNIDADCDYIIVFGGTNDVSSTAPIGTEADNVKTTIMGALNIICTNLINKAPTAKILFITPLNFIANTRVLQITNAIKTICAKYSIPVLDIYSNGNYSPLIDSQLAVYGVSGSDVYHPNELYHSFLSHMVEKKFI